MNKKLIPVIIVIALLGIGGYFLTLNKSSKNSSGTQTVSQATNEASEFAKAIESGKPTICTMSKGADTMEYSIKGKKMRIKTTNTVVDDKGVAKTTIGNMISDEKYFYTWDDSSKQGSKMSLLVPSPSPTSSISPIENAPKLDSQTDYDNLKNEGYTINCKASSIDDAVFIPPSDIKFIDPTEMMKAFPSPKADGTIDMKQIEELQKQYGEQ